MNQDADQNSVSDSHSSSSDVIDSNDAKNATKTDILKINSEGASQQTINNEHIAKNHSIGDIKWKTSIFPYSEVNSFILPIKKDVRTQQNVHLGDTATINIYIPLSL